MTLLFFEKKAVYEQTLTRKLSENRHFGVCDYLFKIEEFSTNKYSHISDIPRIIFLPILKNLGEEIRYNKFNTSPP